MVEKKSNKCVCCGKKKLVMFLAVHVLGCSCFTKKSYSLRPWQHEWIFFTFITTVPRVSAAAFAIWFAKSWKPTFAMFTPDGLAGVKQHFLFITEDSPMSLQAFTTVWKCIDRQAGTMHTSTGETSPRE